MIIAISFAMLLALGSLVFLIWYGMKRLPLVGDPANVSKAFADIIRTQAQLVIGLFIVLVITLLLISGNITSDAGLPIISLVGGYLLGKEVNGRGSK